MNYSEAIRGRLIFSGFHWESKYNSNKSKNCQCKFYKINRKEIVFDGFAMVRYVIETWCREGFSFKFLAEDCIT